MTREEMNQIKEERGYSFKTLSQYSGVPVVTLQKIFSGVTVNPRKVTLDAIERVLTAEEIKYQGKAYEYTAGAKEEMPVIREAARAYGKNQGEYTLEDYYACSQEYRVELIDGVLYDMSSPQTVHQDILPQFYMAFYQYLVQKGKKCKVFLSPVDVQLFQDDRTMVQPDLFLVCDRDKIRDFGIMGSPDYVLEVLSASTRKKDMTLKLAKYQEAGVREYWMLDPCKEVLITYDFTDENFIPNVIPLRGDVPVGITQGELCISLEPIAELIKEYGERIQ